MNFPVFGISSAKDFAHDFCGIHVFLLTTFADAHFLPEVFVYFPELDVLSGSMITFHFPKLNITNTSARERETYKPQFDALIASLRIDTDRTPDNYVLINALRSLRLSSDKYNELINEYVSENERQVLSFINKYKILPDQLPCLVFMPAGRGASSSVIWSLKGQNGKSVVSEFREISSRVADEEAKFKSGEGAVESLIQKKKSCGWSISNLQREIEQLDVLLKSDPSDHKTAKYHEYMDKKATMLSDLRSHLSSFHGSEVKRFSILSEEVKVNTEALTKLSEEACEKIHDILRERNAISQLTRANEIVEKSSWFRDLFGG